jgi:cytochrome c oxidase subunit 3/cytochrome o ubiquinol oxidase subunit 3
MTATAQTFPAATEWKLPSKRKVGMACLIATESSLFTIFVVAYLYNIGKSLNGPYPKDVLHLPILASICLLSSSATVALAERAFKRGTSGAFKLWWFITIALGLEFLGATLFEWNKLSYQHHFTISTNLAGSTFYSLVGLHLSHVFVGLILLSLVFVLSLFNKVGPEQHERLQMIGWYWHFVDVIWLIVFTVVYIIGR